MARIVLEANEFITGIGIHVRGELVLDPLPSGEVSGVLVAVLPHGPPRFEDGTRRSGSDLSGSGQAMLADAADHEGMGVGVESVELRGNVMLRANVVVAEGLRRDLTGIGGDVVVVGGGMGGGGRAEEEDLGERNGGLRLRRKDDVRVVGRKWGEIRVVVVKEIGFGFAGIHGVEMR